MGRTRSVNKQLYCPKAVSTSWLSRIIAENQRRATSPMCSYRDMPIVMEQPGVEELSTAVGVLREWQDDAAPLQLHPGDLGWFWRFGAEATAEAVRTWSRRGRILAVGLLDGATQLRLTMAPDVQRGDDELAHQLVGDITAPTSGVLPAGEVSVEVPTGALLHDLLSDRGWTSGEAWTPLRREFPVTPAANTRVRIEVVGPEQAPVRTAVQRASFDRSRFTEQRWHTMAAGLPYRQARCLVAYDERDNPVAAVTVWSAGPGKPGILEPLGVHREHRGRGHGKAIAEAAAIALQNLGASSAMVCTPSANVGGVATYEAAGFRQLPERLDRCRTAR
jgi:ribosomal protein S18 acetylase RimI-like enzyme